MNDGNVCLFLQKPRSIPFLSPKGPKKNCGYLGLAEVDFYLKDSESFHFHGSHWKLPRSYSLSNSHGSGKLLVPFWRLNSSSKPLFFFHIHDFGRKRIVCLRMLGFTWYSLGQKSEEKRKHHSFFRPCRYVSLSLIHRRRSVRRMVTYSIQ